MSWVQAAVQVDGPVQGTSRAVTRTMAQFKRIVREFVGSLTKEGDIVVASEHQVKTVERREFEAGNDKIGT